LTGVDDETFVKEKKEVEAEAVESNKLYFKTLKNMVEFVKDVNDGKVIKPDKYIAELPDNIQTIFQPLIFNQATKITMLDLQGMEQVDILAIFEKATQLTYLKLPEMTINEGAEDANKLNSAMAFTAALTKSKITNLDLSDVTITGGSSVTVDGCELILNTLNSPTSKITSLTISCENAEVLELGKSFQSKSTSKLKSLALTGLNQDEVVENILSTIHHSGIETLKLGSEDAILKFDESIKDALVKALKSPNCKLTELDLRGAEITPEFLIDIVNAATISHSIVSFKFPAIDFVNELVGPTANLLNSAKAIDFNKATITKPQFEFIVNSKPQLLESLTLGPKVELNDNSANKIGKLIEDGMLKKLATDGAVKTIKAGYLDSSGTIIKQAIKKQALKNKSVATCDVTDNSKDRTINVIFQSAKSSNSPSPTQPDGTHLGSVGKEKVESKGEGKGGG
jgi:hypothetical protein